MDLNFDMLTRLVPPDPPAFRHDYNIVIVFFCAIALMWLLPFIQYALTGLWKRSAAKHEILTIYHLMGRRIRATVLHPLTSILGLSLGGLLILQVVYHLNSGKAAAYGFPHNFFWKAFCYLLIFMGALIVVMALRSIWRMLRSSGQAKQRIDFRGIGTARALLKIIGRLPSKMTKAVDASENRQFVRRQFQAALVKCRLEGAGRGDKIRDISLGGMFVLSRRPFSQGQRIGVAFSSPNHYRSLKFQGRVARVEKTGVAVSFLY